MANSSAVGKSMREHIKQEFAKKLKCCANQTFQCTLPRLEGYDYCLKHILKDSKKHFRLCTYAYKNGKNCRNAVPKYDLKRDPSMTTYCYEHSRQVQLRKTEAAAKKTRPIETNESLLNSLTYHVAIEEEEEKNSVDAEEEIDVVSPYVPTFNLKEQTQNLRTVKEASQRYPFKDYGSDSTPSDNEYHTTKNTLPINDYAETDNETCSEDEDPLKHAGVYTREEVVRITLEKTVKLRDLYLSQLQHLHHVLREKRRRYLVDLKKERESLCSIHEQVKDNPAERKLAAEMKSLNSYHRRHGQEALLYKKFREKRSRQNDSHIYKGQGHIKCIFTEGGVKCTERSLPCCKYCRKHILEDKKQVLFKACNVERGGVICQEPVPCIYEESACNLHIRMPDKKQYIPKKFESDTDEDIDEVKLNVLSDTGTAKLDTSMERKNVDLPKIEVQDIDYPSTSALIRSLQKSI